MWSRWWLEGTVSVYTVLSNHHHALVTDPEGRICDFTRDCHAFIARAANAAHGDFEGFWSSEQTSHVTCVEPSDLVAKIAYAMANPVEACLVKHGRSWPGVRVAWPRVDPSLSRSEGFHKAIHLSGCPIVAYRDVTVSSDPENQRSADSPNAHTRPKSLVGGLC